MKKDKRFIRCCRLIVVLGLIFVSAGSTASFSQDYRGKYCDGKGDPGFLRMIDRSFQFFHPNPDTQNLSMLYNSSEDRLKEGAVWPGWWVENCYGTTYCSIPFLSEPYFTMLQHAHDVWFYWQGDGKTTDTIVGKIVPDGLLSDIGGHVHGDFASKGSDWTLEDTAAAVVMQAEMLLRNRDMNAVRHYLPKLDRACNCVETRRDPENGLLLAGSAANLTGFGGYCGIRQPDGTYGMGYLACLSVTHLAALDRMVELLKMAGDEKRLEVYEARQKMSRESLRHLLTPEGYFISTLAKDGTRFGVLSQDKWNYFDSFVNIDAIGLRVVDRAQAEKIYAQIAAVPQLRPYGPIIANYPSRDDTSIDWGGRHLTDLLAFGYWNNGSAWIHLEGRAIMAYYMLGKYDDIQRSFAQFMRHAWNFQLDAPFSDFGYGIYFPDRPTNLCIDAFSIPAGVIRGLFEYSYKANGLVLRPHIPASISEYTQKAPIWYGGKKLMISVKNGGPRVGVVRVNGREVKTHSDDAITLRFNMLPMNSQVDITMTGGWEKGGESPEADWSFLNDPAEKVVTAKVMFPPDFEQKNEMLREMLKKIGKGPEADRARAFLSEAANAFDACRERVARQAAGMYGDANWLKRIEMLRHYYPDSALAMFDACVKEMGRYASSANAKEKKIAGIWNEYQINVTGKVTNANGAGVENTRVWLDDPEQSVTTDKNGEYKLAFLGLPGKHVIYAGKQFHELAIAKVKAAKGKTLALNISLKPRPNSGDSSRTYFVRPGGDDANSGLTEKEAWASIDNGDRRMLLNPGDRVMVLSGDYNVIEPVRLRNCSGAEGKPIRYAAQGVVTINSSLPLDTVLFIQGPGANYLLLDGIGTRGGLTGIAMTDTSHNEIRNCKVDDCSIEFRAAFSMERCGDNLIHHNLIRPHLNLWNSIYGIKVGSSTGTNKFFNNTFVGVGGSAGTAFSCTGNQRPVEFKNNVITKFGVGVEEQPAKGGLVLQSHNMIFGMITTMYAGVNPGDGDSKSDPQLDPNGHPKPGSPTLDAGVDVGLAYTGRAPDLGAFEW